MQIKPNRIKTNRLRISGLLLFCNLFIGCNTTRTEWVHHGEWVYQNVSANEIRITGVITSFTTQEYGTLTLSPGESRTVEFWSDGERDIPPTGIGFPLDGIYGDRECSIMIDDTKTLPLEPDKGIRNRNDYTVEKLGRAHYRFTYTFTDAIIDHWLKATTDSSE